MKTKKELKAAYKEMKPIAGVFQVENTQNGMVLIEGAADMQSKWNRHQTELKFGSHRNKKLQQDWNDCGVENFVYSIQSELKLKEDGNTTLSSELKLLRVMLEEELVIPRERRY